MVRGRPALLAALVVVAALLPAASSQGGEVPEDVMIFCDFSPPQTFWGAGEEGEQANSVTAAFEDNLNGIIVENRVPGLKPADAFCSTPEDEWTTFIANLGALDDSVRMDAVGLEDFYPGDPGPVPERILAEIDMGDGNDEALGHSGVDEMLGGPGKDLLKGFAGNDRIKGDSGKDKIRSGPGRDKVKAAGGGKDKVNCGPDKDKVVVDRKDKVQRCEKVKVR